jgi:FKBP-type peptidyl-prolyl cis-trans isomerase FkpA
VGWLLVACVVASAATGLRGGQDPVFATSLGVDLSTMERSGGVYWRDLAIGQGTTARDGSKLTIHYTGWLADGTRFESSRDGDEPVTFTLGERRAIRGWEEGIRGMRVGGTRQLVIPPRLAYGGRGVPGRVPPNASLVFEVDLVAMTR